MLLFDIEHLFIDIALDFWRIEFLLSVALNV